MIEAQAAVLWPDEDQLAIEPVALAPPRDDEVLIKVTASGICHTDLVLMGASVVERPVVLGHEGSGVVQAVGAAVTSLKPGDPVVMSYASCGHCGACNDQAAAYCDQFFPLNFMGRRLDGEWSMLCREQSVGSRIFGQSALANFAVCHVRNVVKIDARMPLKLAGPLGCGLQTGAGAVLNSLAVPQGAEVLVLGAGAVGLAAIMAASSIVGAATVAALDIHPSRLALAQSVGATQVFDGRREDVFATLQAAFPSGVQYIIDTTGQVDLVNQCAALLATRGRLGLVASYDPQSMLSMNAVTVLTRGQHVQGIMAGDSDIQRLIPELVAHYLEGRFPIDRLVRYYAFAEVNDAVAASRSGSVVKPIVVMAD